MPQLAATGAEGVGLFRTEIPFMMRDTFPAVDDQTEFYRRVFDQADGRPVVFRTLDIGGDKVLPYLPHAAEDNPAMGWRAIRIGLDRPAMLREQLRALVRAAEGRDLLRQVSDDRRDRRARTGARAARSGAARAAEEGRTLPASVKIGVMLEVPALLWQLPALCRRIDFLSIGTNDLLQFLFACDRGNPRLADRYDPLSAPMLALLREVVAQTSPRGGAAQHVRRDGRQPDRSDGADRPRLPDLVDGRDRNRPGQDNDPQPRCRRSRRICRPDRRPSRPLAET